MMEAPGLNIPHNTAEIDEAFVQSSYVNATEFLKSQFSYIFKEPKGKVATYTIGTWSHKIKPSVVRKRGNGTSEDITLLQKPTNYNKSHKTKRTINPGERQRVRKVAKIGTGKRNSMQGNGEPVGIHLIAVSQYHFGRLCVDW